MFLGITWLSNIHLPTCIYVILVHQCGKKLSGKSGCWPAMLLYFVIYSFLLTCLLCSSYVNGDESLTSKSKLKFNYTKFNIKMLSLSVDLPSPLLTQKKVLSNRSLILAKNFMHKLLEVTLVWFAPKWCLSLEESSGSCMWLGESGDMLSTMWIRTFW